MKIIPAIDIQDGKCVRLTKGDLNSTVKYFDDPIQAAEHWYSYGIERIHIVDLDGAKKGQSLILKIIDDIKKKSETLVQASMKLGEAIYKSQQNTKPGSDKDDGNDNKEKKDDNVVDADFEEVKDENKEKSA